MAKWLEVKGKNGSGPRRNKAVTPKANKGEPPNPLAGVNFASDAAAEVAAGAGLRAEDFAGKEPESARGFTVGDVRDLVGGAG